ncbi:hypothetical protein LZT09_13950 [Vibrio fluvialis]|uniref:hypothetical protein n=1 Tax=Vibrio TaxID=662 RepID=UPI0011D9E3B2|nr:MULTISPECIES: hypothetical protein [Vibrio]EKO3434970.1 hypothetical protein [Vibrio fluvialis]MBY8138791.1 hypothetical protein [Vibrio fluvialis]MCE7615731.1 hypothetical protein [Vibrio fluvialis]TXY57652.1 hypothetical protein FXE91_10870 [Vibrio cholerae]GHX89591.1 hypothetical protein VCSRO111_0622 [Vibrio cholerae]
MITAKEAKEISGPDSSDYLAEIEQIIRDAAKNKSKKVTIRKSPYASWLYNEKSLSQAEKEAIASLRKSGFDLSLYYCESQFVDMGLVISWGG